MSSLLNEVNKVDQRSQHERKIIETLNKKKEAEVGPTPKDDKEQPAAEKLRGKNYDDVKTYDSKFSLKIFKLIGVDPMASNTESKRTNFSAGAE